MDESKTSDESLTPRRQDRESGMSKHAPEDSLDPGAFIGREPELEAETIPGGLEPKDERVAAYDSRPGTPEEPADRQ
jgi:hypothetical protein